jgi:hypothetical protein
MHMKLFNVSIGRIALLAAAVLVILYAIAGFFILPSILKSTLTEELTSSTRMKAAIGSVHINPFALSLTVDDCSLTDRDNESFFTVKRFYCNFELRSLFTGAATFSEIAIDSPFVHVKIYRDGTTNLPVFGGADTSHAASARADSAQPFFVMIDRFVLTRGRTIYEDRSHGTPRIARFDSLNLTLTDFTTRPGEQGGYAFDAGTDRGEKISWRGSLQVAPLMSAGSIAVTGFKARTLWEFMQDRLEYELTDGDISAHADYVFDMSGKGVVFTLHKGEVNARSVRLVDNATKTEQVTLPTATVAAIDLDYAAKAIRIGSVTGANAVLHTARDTMGNFSITSLMMMKPDTSAPKEAPWKIALGKIQVEDFSLDIADRNTVPATEIVLSPVSLTIEHYTVLSSTPASLAVRGNMKPAGSFTVTGTFTDEPVTAAITIACSGIHLPTFQRFVDKSANLKIASGALAVNGKVAYAARLPVPVMNFSGGASVTDFRATDPLVKKDFLRWKSLEIRRIAFTRAPASLDISEIVASQAYIRFVIDSTRTTNVQKIMAIGADSTARPDSSARPDSRARADSTAPGDAPIPTRIGIIRIVDGSMNFADFSLSPNFVTGIQEMNGTIEGLNSQQLTHAEVAVDGKVDRYAPVEIRGQINPLSEQAFTDIAVNFHNIELTTFTPYFGKFAGYKIDKGKLSLDLHYKLNKKFLEAENNIIVDQLTLGEKVEGPDVTSLPVRLAIALLRDSKGVIDLHLPLKGSLDDPEFSIFPIVMKVFVNLIVKAVTSPFKLLGSLLGGGSDDLSYVQFRPGVDTLDAGEQAKLVNLAKALNERPALRLDVRGLAADSLDGRAIAESRLLRQIRSKGGKGAAVTEEDDDRILQIFRERFNADPATLLPASAEGKAENDPAIRKAAIAAAARQKLTASLLPDDDVLFALARRRATSVKDRLVFHAGIEEGRIFLLDFQKGAKVSDGIVQMPLSLDAQ